MRVSCIYGHNLPVKFEIVHHFLFTPAHLERQIRWNCRGILNDVGSLHENGRTLDAMGIFPEEFLVYDPMHLLKSDLAKLQAEFAAEDAKPKAPPAIAT